MKHVSWYLKDQASLNKLIEVEKSIQSHRDGSINALSPSHIWQLHAIRTLYLRGFQPQMACEVAQQSYFSC